MEKNRLVSTPEIKFGILAAFLLWLMHLIPYLLPEARLWGFNHLIFLPPPALYLYLIAGAFCLVLLLPPLRGQALSLFDNISEVLFHRKNYTVWIPISVALLLIFWFGRMSINLLGDGYSVINNIGNDLPVQFKWSESGAIRLVFWVSQILPMEGLERGQLAYALVSVLSGGITVYFFFLLAHELVKDHRERLFVFCLLVFSGWSLLFFGYSESYPVLWPIMSGYLFFSARYQNGRGNLLVPTTLLAAGLFLHLETAFFLISYPILLFSKGYGLKLYRRYKVFLWIGLLAVVAAGMVIFINKYQAAVDFQQHFLPLFTGRPATPGYAVFSPIHLIDILNEVTLLLPLWPLLLLFSREKWRRALKDPVDRFLLGFILGGGVFLAIIDPTLGMGRDWDLFAISCLGPVFLLARWAITSEKDLKNLFPGLACLSLILTLPFLVTNLTYDSHMDYVKWQMRLDRLRSKTGLILLRGYYQDINDQRLVDSVNQAIVVNFPQLPMVDRARALVNEGKYQEALILADRIYRADPYTFEGYFWRGMANMNMGNLSRAIPDLEQALKFAQWNSYVFVNLAGAYQTAGKYEKALGALRRVQELNPQLGLMFEGFAMTFNALGQYDSAFVYSRQLMLAEPQNRIAYLVAGAAAYRLGNRTAAKTYLNRFLEMNPPESERSQAEAIVRQLP